MERDLSISNEDKFALYARLYNSMGLDLTYINGYFGQKNILRVFSVYNFFKYYDDEIYEARLGKAGNVLWIIFHYQKDASPIFRVNLEKAGVSEIYGAEAFRNDIEKNDYITTGLPCSGFFCFKNGRRVREDNFEDWDWWADAVICENKDISTNKINYQVLHKDELKALDKDEIDYALSQYDQIQLFKRPISYFKKRNRQTDSYPKVEWKAYYWAKATGIGVMTGGNSYRCIDIDGCHSVEFLKDFLNTLGFESTYSWVVNTGSNNGFHIWVKTKELPANLMLSSQADKLFRNAGFIVFEAKDKYKETFKRIEIRWNCHVVMPPSTSGYGYKYNFIDGIPLYEPKEILPETLLDAIRTFGFNTSLNYEEIVKNSIIDIGPSVRRYSVYQAIILSLDIETTGLAKDLNATFDEVENWPYVVQFGYQIIAGLRRDVIKEGNFTLKPEGFSIPESSTVIHGISNSEAIENGWNRAEFYKFFVEQLNYVHYIVVHNADFDINVIKCELLRYTDLSKDKVEDLFRKPQIICTMKASTNLCKIKNNSYSDEYKYPSLNELYRFLFNKELTNAHNALSDVRATTECFLELNKRGIVNYSRNSPIRLNFWSENKYCTYCGGNLKEHYENAFGWSWDDGILKCENCGMLYIAGCGKDDLYF